MSNQNIAPTLDPICHRPIAIADLILTEAKRKEVLALLAALDDDELRFVKAEVRR